MTAEALLIPVVAALIVGAVLGVISAILWIRRKQKKLMENFGLDDMPTEEEIFDD